MQYVPRLQFEIELEYTRSRGPGGQHVNRTNSAALLRWSLKDTLCFTEEQKQHLLLKLAKQMTVDGDLILRSDEFRDQEANRKRVFEKLDEILIQAFFVPKKRRATKPSHSAKVKRRNVKRQRGEIKANRGKVRQGDD